MKSIQIPKGFIKSDIQLPYLNWKQLEIFEKYIIPMLSNSNTIVFYSKEKIRNVDLTDISFYVRKQDELNVIYRIGQCYNAMFNYISSHEIINNEFDIPPDYLKKVCLKRK